MQDNLTKYLTINIELIFFFDIQPFNYPIPGVVKPPSFSINTLLALAAPIALASAVQNIITLTDSFFLIHLGQLDFAAMGMVSPVYLMVAAIGFGFSRGGQIIIARRAGEQKYDEYGRVFSSMMLFQLCLALVMFCMVRFGAHVVLPMLVKDEGILEKGLQYLDYRAYGVFFSYSGLALIAFYLGTNRTIWIVLDTLILAVINIVSCYALVFGKWGFPALGIAGAGLAGSIAEAVAFFIFVGFAMADPQTRSLRLFHFKLVGLGHIRRQLELAGPIVLQSALGLSTWVSLFAAIEKIGSQELAISNLARMIYLMLCIPIWGFSVAVNVWVSKLIGEAKSASVLSAIRFTALVCFFISILIALPVLIFPEFFLSFFLGPDPLSIVAKAKPIFPVLFMMLVTFSFAGIYYNGLLGTGATVQGLKIQALCVVVYNIYLWVVVYTLRLGLQSAWCVEILFWLLALGLSIIFLKNGRWQTIKV